MTQLTYIRSPAAIVYHASSLLQKKSPEENQLPPGEENKTRTARLSELHKRHMKRSETAPWNGMPRTTGVPKAPFALPHSDADIC